MFGSLLTVECIRNLYFCLFIVCVNTRTSMIKTNALFDCTDFQDENARASRASTEELLCTLPLLAKTPAAINDVRLELMYYVNHHLSKKSFLKKLHQLQLAIKRKGRSKAVARLVETRSLLETDILSACERILYEIQDHEDGASPVTLLYHEILGQVKTCLLGIKSFCLMGIILFVCWAFFSVDPDLLTLIHRPCFFFRQ